MIGEPEVVEDVVPGTALRPDKGEERKLEQRAEKDREEAFSFEPMWKGKKLEPWSFSRELLFLKLRAANGAPEFSQAVQGTMAFVPDALRMLYLMHHTPEDWIHLLGDLVRFETLLVEQWAERNVDRKDYGSAVLMALKVWNAARLNEHEPVPEASHGKGEEAGN